MSRHFARPRRFGGGLTKECEGAGIYFERFRAAKPLFVVALETGLSKRDLLGLKWSEVGAQIPLSKACRQALKECGRRAAKAPECVFVTEAGVPYSVSTLERLFKLAKAIAEIERRLRFHDLRHTFASRLASENQSLQVIARTLGHTSTRMAERYARPDEDTLRGVARALDRDAANSSRELLPGVAPANLERVKGIEPSTFSLGS